jgi:hypothetical protein
MVEAFIIKISCSIMTFGHLRSFLVVALMSISLVAATFGEILFSQEFSSGTRVEDYVGSGPNQFDHIGSTGTPGNYVEEIRNDDLVLRTEIEPAGGTPGQGFTRVSPYLNGHEAIRVEISIAFNNDVGPINVFGAFEFGSEFPGPYASASKVRTHRFLRLHFRRDRGSRLFLINRTNEGQDTVELGPDTLSGGFIHYQIILNDSSREIRYEAPGALGKKTVSPGHFALYFDKGSGWKTGFDNILAANGEQADLSKFRFLRSRIDAAPEPPEGQEKIPTLAAIDRLVISSLEEVR